MSDPDAPADLRGALCAAAAESSAVRLAVLFGSVAAERPRAGSDVDVAVLLEDDDAATRRRAEVVLGRAVSRAAGRDLDLVFLDDAPPQLRFQVARHGVPVYTRDDRAWSRFKARAMLDWWDWKPYARRIHAAAVDRVRQRVAADG